jgi:nucleoside 2-deoxyribosyltransferase
LTKVYLAHSGQEKEQGLWIQERLEDAGYEVINPFRKENPFIHDLKWDNGKVVGELSAENCEWIVETDFKLIDESDAVVMIYPQKPIPTIGTPCEMLYAHQKNKPLYIFTPSWMLHHPWVQHMASLQFSDIIGLLCYMELLEH